MVNEISMLNTKRLQKALSGLAALVCICGLLVATPLAAEEAEKPGQFITLASTTSTDNSGC